MRATVAEPYTSWRGVALFVVLAYAITWTTLLGLRAAGVPLEMRATFGMFGPALACAAVRRARREGWSDAGLRLPPRGARWLFLAAYAIPAGALVAAALISALTGLQTWDFTRGIAAEWSATKFWSLLSLVLTAVVAATMLSTFGEELGWRGYLLPRLLPRFGAMRASMVVGIVWGLWHMPLIVLDGRGFGRGREVLGVAMFTVLCVAWSVYLTWLRVRSDSLWPCVLSHAVLNVVTSTLFALYNPDNLVVGAPIGLTAVACFLAVDLWLLVSRRIRS